MRRLLIVLLVASSLGFVGRGGVPCDAIEAQPQCLVALLPGPTANTLDILEMGGDVSASSGELLLTTVSVQATLGLRDWLRGSFDDRISHIDRDLLYPPGTTVAQVREANVQSMQLSQLEAILAAFTAMGVEDLYGGAAVVEVADYSDAADGTLRPGDVIVEAAGTQVRVRTDLTAALSRFGAGDEVALVIERAAFEGDDAPARLEVSVSLVQPADADRALLGITAQDHYNFPVDVNIDAGEIGGPSAGLMFSLAIIDASTPDDLTGGRIIAGTGEIDPDGTVGPIGGILQKVLGATSRYDYEAQEELPPATVFLVPVANMPEASRAHVRSEIMLVPVATLSDALAALDDLRAGERPSGTVTLTP